MQVAAYVEQNLAGSERTLRLKGLLCQSKSIIHRFGQVLLGAEIIHGGLNRSMTEEKLDLLECTAGLTTEPGAGSAKVMWREIPELEIPGILSHNSPHRIFGKSLGADRAPLVDAPKQRPRVDRRGRHPLVEEQLDPSRNWNRPDTASFANEVR